jgi:hypothetical protein
VHREIRAASYPVSSPEEDIVWGRPAPGKGLETTWAQFIQGPANLNERGGPFSAASINSMLM